MLRPGTRARVAGEPQRVDEAGLGRVRYQLVHAAAGALIEARERGSAQAVLVIHEFLSEGSTDGTLAGTRPEHVERNARDLDVFVGALGGAAGAPSALHGPFLVPGGGRVPSGLPLFVGKATRWLGSASP